MTSEPASKPTENREPDSVCPDCGYDCGGEFIRAASINPMWIAKGEPSDYTNWCPRCGTEFYVIEGETQP